MPIGLKVEVLELRAQWVSRIAVGKQSRRPGDRA